MPLHIPIWLLLFSVCYLGNPVRVVDQPAILRSGRATREFVIRYEDVFGISAASVMLIRAVHRRDMKVSEE